MRRSGAASGEKAMRGASLAMVGVVGGVAGKQKKQRSARFPVFVPSILSLFYSPCVVLFCVFKDFHCWRERDKERER